MKETEFDELSQQFLVEVSFDNLHFPGVYVAQFFVVDSNIENVILFQIREKQRFFVIAFFDVETGVRIS